jgi:hypothetical protein
VGSSKRCVSGVERTGAVPNAGAGVAMMLACNCLLVIVGLWLWLQRLGGGAGLSTAFFVKRLRGRLGHNSLYLRSYWVGLHT